MYGRLQRAAHGYVRRLEVPHDRGGADDPELPRKEWSVSHTAANRPAFVSQLRKAGRARRRLGIAVHTQQAVVRISLHANRLKLRYHTLTTNADR